MQQPLCHHEATSTRLKAGLPKGGGTQRQRDPQSDDVKLPTCPGLPSSRLEKKRPRFD